MKISINDHRKVFAIQEEFSSAFPNLKIEFYSKPHNSSGTSSNEFIKGHGKTLGECRTVHKDGEITITPQMTAANLEHNFADVYGIGIQIFSKSGNNWMETNNDRNSLTLEELNK